MLGEAGAVDVGVSGQRLVVAAFAAIAGGQHGAVGCGQGDVIATTVEPRGTCRGDLG